MSATVIRDFLVSLGFSVDKKSELAFNDSLKKTAENAVKLGLAIEAAAAAVTGAVVKLAQGMERSYYQSKRLGGSVKDINAVGYAISQVGGSAEGAKQSMEGIADFMRRLPGGKSFIQKMVGTEADVSNVPAVMGVLAKKFANMPYANAKVQANMIGIDDNTLQAMIRDGGKYYDEYQKLVKKAGVNEDKLAGDSQQLMTKVRSLGASFSVLGEKIQQALLGKAGAYVDKFKNWVDENFDSITKFAVKLSVAILHAADTIVGFIKSAIKWYDDLDPKGKSWAKTIAAIAGSMWLLNKAFGSSPIGIILQLATAIGTLYADYQNWKKTGEVGLVDWSEWEPTIEKVTGALETISGWFKTLAGDDAGGIGSLQTAMGLFATFMATKWVASLLASFGRVKGGWLNLVAAFGTVAATDIYGTYQEGAELQKHVDAGDAKEWLEDRNSKSFGTRLVRRGTNWLYRQFGAEEPYDENLRTKGTGGKGSGRALPVAENSISDEEKALLQTISSSEANSYNVIYGGQKFGDYSDHPRIAVPIGTGPNAGKTSSAAGRYQFIQSTWDNQRRKLGLPDFSPQSQDKAALDLAATEYKRKTGRQLNEDLKGADPERIAEIGKSLRGQWTSLPGGIEQGQSADAFVSRYKSFLARMQKDKEVAKKQKDQEKFITDRLSSLPEGGLPMTDGPFMPNGVNPTAPLLPSNIANTSTANMNLKVENNFMGGASEKQVQDGIEKGGRVLLRNMQPAIR